MAVIALNARSHGGPAHPNELDRRRIERAIQDRLRYRYVRPKVFAIEEGYRIESPCCSRNVDPNGGVIDVALILFDKGEAPWQLLRKDHGEGRWELHSRYRVLPELLGFLNADPERLFWQ